MPQEVRVRFDPLAAGRFRARLTDAVGDDRGTPVEFEPFLTDDDYADLRWYLEEYMDLPDGGAVVRAAGIEARLAEWGRRLYDAVFASPGNRAELRRLVDGPEPRELTVATDLAPLLRLPWELMADDAGILANRVSVRRQLAEPEGTVPHAVQLPLRLLYVVSRPGDTGFIDPRMTTKSLFAALDPLGASAEVDFCRPPTLARMEEMLRAAQAAGRPYHVVHFDGHGTFVPEAQIGALCFEKPDDGAARAETDLVLADRLGNLLAQYRVPLVVLEACRSGTVGKTAVFRSVAPRLIQSGVGSVLSMGHAVHVEAARVLLDRFYRELVRGATIGHAAAQGRAALVASPARWVEYGPGGKTIKLTDWFLPHLYQRGPDDVLLPARAAAPAPRQYDLFLSHNHADSGRVEALARMLVGTHGLRVWMDKWECKPGQLKPQCEKGIRNSRFTVVVGSQAALDSEWVAWEIARHVEQDAEGERLLPVKFEPLKLPEHLNGLLWVDCRDPARDAEGAAEIARLIRSVEAEDARRRRGFRPPPRPGEPGGFPRPPRYGFQGRARELYDLERSFRRHRGVVLHAMGGMGKTTLATEAADWWTRSGLFRDGACFVSFEQFASADRVVQVFGNYCEGPTFDQRPAADQRERAVEYFRERDVLLVWDNYESVLPQFNDGAADHGSPYTDDERRRLADLFRDLTEGDGKGRLLVTCRPGETDLPGAQKVELHGLARADSLWLLHRVLEKDGLTLGNPRLAREKLDPLLDDLADHPLSLELVGPHLKSLTPETIREDFGKLLATFETKDADEKRNQSLLASLEFSRRHLSPEARAALPWLGLFRGGVFEVNLLAVSGIDPAAWEPIRRELQGIALLRVEDDINIGNRPFLRFHPTLGITSADDLLSQQAKTRERFIESYVGLMRSLDQALSGSQSRAALEVLDCEEANYRTAVRWAVADQRYQTAASLGSTFRTYLQRSGRLRERDAYVRWLRDAVVQAGFSVEAVEVELDLATTLCHQGDPRGAVDRLQNLIERLHGTTAFDATVPLASAVAQLGRVLYNCGASIQAIPILREAVHRWESLVVLVGGIPWEQILAKSDQVKGLAELGNLSAAMGDLANALCSVGQRDEALSIAENCVRIQQRLGALRNVAACHGMCAMILTASGHYDQADARFELALAAAREAGDKEVEGTTLQHQGSLADDRNQIARAATLYQQALQSFQEADDQSGMMQTYSLLGVIEQKAGRLAVARAWYTKSRELAVQLQDEPGIAQAAQNIGIVCQEEGEAARRQGDDVTARRHFGDAITWVEESLRNERARSNNLGEADSLYQLSKIYLLLGNFDMAEQYARAALEIREPLGVKETVHTYNILAHIAQTRGDAEAAARWARKRDDLRAEFQRRAGGFGVPADWLRALQQLAVACARAGLDGEPLPPAAHENLAALDGSPTPLPAVATHLREFVAGRTPPVPAEFPRELRDLLEQLTRAIRQVRGGS